MNIKLKTLISCFFLLTVLVACQATSTPTAEDETQAPQPSAPTSPPQEEPTAAPTLESEPIILRVGGVHDIDCWNPFACSEIYNFMYYYVLEGLMSLGKDYSCSPFNLTLAESMEVSEDGMTWTIHLVEGVTFSDGTPFNAQTVVDNLNFYYENEGLRYWYMITTYMTSVEALDDLTVQITTEIPSRFFKSYEVIWIMMLPPHVLNDLTDDTMYAFDFFPPVGTGPFTVAEWVQGEYIIYDARDDYYLGKPPVDRIIYQIYANSDTMIQALLAGEVDVLMNQPAVSPVYYETLAAAEDITVLDLPPGPIHSLTFNLHSEGNKHPAIDDLVVRQAIDSAIDKEQLIDITLLGHGMTCPNGYICGPQDIYEGTINPDLKIKPYDPELSREILEEAGYTDQDGDGIREDANGLPLEFRLAFMAQDPVHLTMAESIRDWLQVIGIDVEVDATDYTTLMHVIQSERDFDMAIIGVAAETEPVSMDFYYSCWSSGSSSSWNFSGYCNPEFDELLFGMTAASSSGEYQEASFMAQEVLHRDLPVIILLGQNNLQAFRTDKFEFDTDVCQGFQGVWDPQNIMNIEVK